MHRSLLVATCATFGLAAGCGGPAADQQSSAAAPAATQDAPALQAQATALFQPLPATIPSEANPVTEAKVSLGRMLYYDARLSKGGDVSCNSCHGLDTYGVDNSPTSSGHQGQKGGRNSPTTYNAALHVAQFWDGRAADVEAQAKGPVLNPVEMAMADAAAVEAVLRAIPGYAAPFAAAFPGEAQPVTFDNMALAIGAFERGLVTPSAFDRFLGGDVTALDASQLAGLKTFIDSGCGGCHNGAAVGGGTFQKLGLVKPFETADIGRAEATKSEADRFFFKVPSLRNIDKTAPYFHDGKVADLDGAVRLMAEHQLGRTLGDAEVAAIRSFLASLTGTIPAEYIAPPQLPGTT